MSVIGFDARRVSNDTVHILDPPTPNALHVMVIILDPRLITSAGRVWETDPADQSLARKVMHDQMDGLQRDRRQAGPDCLKDRLGVGMRLTVKKVQHRDSLTGCSQSVSSEVVSPLVNMTMICGMIRHAMDDNSLILVSQYSESLKSCFRGEGRQNFLFQR